MSEFGGAAFCRPDDKGPPNIDFLLIQETVTSGSSEKAHFLESGCQILIFFLVFRLS